jgi:hypothetical protein
MDEDAAPQPTPNAQTNYEYLDTSILPYKFKAGSYWVYQNDSTLALDSILVDSVSAGFVITVPSVHGSTDQTESEFFKMNIHDFGNSMYYNECLMSKKIIRNFGGDYFHFYGQATYMSNSSLGTSYHGIEIIAKFVTTTVNGNSYNYVDEVKITAANQYQPEFTSDTYLYYTNTVGLIKKEFVIGPGNMESWSLIRWHVIK